MSYKYTCNYCGNNWQLSNLIADIMCPKCGDSNCKKEIIEEKKTSTYYGIELDDNGDKFMYWGD